MGLTVLIGHTINYKNFLTEKDVNSLRLLFSNHIIFKIIEFKKNNYNEKAE